MLNLIVIVYSIGLVVGLPPIVPQEKSYCVANGFSSDSNVICATVDAFITETDLLNNGMTFEHQDGGSDNRVKTSRRDDIRRDDIRRDDGAIVTSSPVRASYLATGTANYFSEYPELLYTGRTIDSHSDGLSLDNRGQDAFDYLSVDSSNSIVDILVKRIAKIKSLGANAIRFDELDVCTNVKCFENYLNVMRQVCLFMRDNDMAVIGNNNSNHFENYPSFAEMIKYTNVNVAGWIVESGQTLEDLFKLHDILGENVPIYAICTSGDCETDDGQSYSSLSLFKSISYYNY